MLLLAPIGLFIFSRRNRSLALGMGLSWVALTYIVGANLAWWAGASFGNRYFLGLTPFFAVMLAALLQHSFYWLLAVTPCIVWSFGLWLQTLDGTLKIGEASFYSLQSLALNQINAPRNLPLLIEPFGKHWLSYFSPWIVLVVISVSVVISGGGSTTKSVSSPATTISPSIIFSVLQNGQTKCFPTLSSSCI